MREVRAAGRTALRLATELLQRARLADPRAGVWEAADVQWWWRSPRRSDVVDQLFWVDDEGPAAGVVVTSWAGGRWQCDPVRVPGVQGVDVEQLWRRALAHAGQHAPRGFDVPVDDDDGTFGELARRSGLSAGDQDGTAWMDTSTRPAVVPTAAGFVLVDRTQRAGTPHPMRRRSGDTVAERLRECSLYDPALDLCVETADGETAGYSLYWFDPRTKVGLVELVRVEDGFQRRGLARAMLAAGLERLAARGAERVKVSFEALAAEALYTGMGFGPSSTTTWWHTGPSTEGEDREQRGGRADGAAARTADG
ncbi:GNAT family N-acetyltransferase [Georgenia sp. H159]|uniref:GNAT family N-acetyltransferase n=1 Tax=Georgenia sp. H159 TaxID=3076115 RepID=UPI002D799462|nr:GNAT family N-acetyltransferase [Georgenia sp. H159]